MTLFDIVDAYDRETVLLAGVEADGPIEALNRYCDREGFAPYAPAGSPEHDAIVATLLADGTATATFTSYEIRAVPASYGGRR